MQIGIDISSALPPRTGIGNYTFGFIQKMLEANYSRDDQFNLFVNSLRKSKSELNIPKQQNLKLSSYKIPGPWLLKIWQNLEWPPIEFFNGRVDLFHSPATIIPPQNSGKKVTTIHDLWFLENPDQCDQLGGNYIASRLKKKIKDIDGIIAVSEFTRLECIKHFNINPEKIFTIYNGIDQKFLTEGQPPNSEIKTIEGKALPSEYILSVSTLEPRKNFPRLIEAYQIALELEPDIPPLVITGMNAAWSSGQETIKKQLENSGAESKVLFTGYVEDSQMPQLYKNAETFILTSFCEGFGIPALEAMASGTKVNCSKGSALDEITKGFALQFDPEDPEEISEKLLITLNETDSDKIKQAQQHARGFTWEKCAEETYQTYKKILG